MNTVDTQISGRELDAQIAKAIGYVSMTTQLNLDGTYGTLPHFSTNISDAWLVVEEMKRRGYWWKMHSHENRVHIKFSKGNGVWKATEETAPLAITTAALKAIEEGDKS